MKRATAMAALLAAGGLAAGRADAQHMGSGSGKSSVTPPPARSSGTAAERAELPAGDLPIEPRHGLLGAPGAALDSGGPSRLGAHAERAARPSYGESAGTGAGSYEAHEAWRSGDRVRSWSSADVRAARQQQAPDLEWATAQGVAPGPQARPAQPRQEGVQGKRGRAKR